MAEIKKTVYKQVLVRMWRNWDSYIATRTVKWWSYFGKWYFKKKLTLSNHMGTFTPRHILKRNENICPHICCVFSRLVMSNSLRPMDCRPPGSSLHGIFQARILEWVAISFSKGSSQPRDQTYISCIGRQILLPLSHLGSPVHVYVCTQILLQNDS